METKRPQNKRPHFVYGNKRPRIAKAVLRKNGAGEINLPAFSLHYKATVIKTVWVLAQKQKYRPMGLDRKLRINPCTYGYLIFAKEARIYNGAKTASSINGAGKTGQLHVKE